jgi:hypothetical protein
MCHSVMHLNLLPTDRSCDPGQVTSYPPLYRVGERKVSAARDRRPLTFVFPAICRCHFSDEPCNEWAAGVPGA